MHALSSPAATLQGTDKKGNPIMYDLEGPINFSVFPGLQVRPGSRGVKAQLWPVAWCEHRKDACCSV